MEALLWFINTAAKVSALTTAGGDILQCNTKLRGVVVANNNVFSLNVFFFLLSLQ